MEVENDLEIRQKMAFQSYLIDFSNQANQANQANQTNQTNQANKAN
jgi:hypothetical protein